MNESGIFKITDGMAQVINDLMKYKQYKYVEFRTTQRKYN